MAYFVNRRRMGARPDTDSNISPKVPLASGTGDADPERTTLSGPSNPEISEALTVAPEVVYSPIVPDREFVTNKSDPETTRPIGPDNPEISEA
jgi:hypothetical protein